ncbi:hypothetical protein Q8W71_22675 [Methylobacterium sp. NEAU 140]|uniref:hypothetical protein n=1 Tax=Methylobacterium sp. NEAU 140 TaxID=3064945 RepID=UPI00273714A4|nr:hypothetical protein [Methylobacterium sp. NEAU 140]MDP4025441.1 hypothetical protein [Methylobacterium sp. NEAU 140]
MRDLMRHWRFGLFIAALIAGALAIGGTWSLMTPAVPPTASDTAATPNPTPNPAPAPARP